MNFSKKYIDAWNSFDEETYIKLFAPNSAYTDVTMELSYVGEAEIRRMFRSTMQYYVDPQFIYVNGFSNAQHYMVEWVSISKVEGKEYKTRVVSVGDLDAQGRIVENRDYWNPQTVPNGDHNNLAAEAAAFKKHWGNRL